MPKKDENILVICAHSDDQIFGVGGTIARYSDEGKNVNTVIFSYGESTHPWLKRKVSVEMRVKESIEADKVVGGHGVIFFGLKEGRFKEEGKKKRIKEKLIRLIDEKKPTKIFTHSETDPHPDHKAVYATVLSAVKKTNKVPDIYTFEVWTPVKIKNRKRPKLVVDITKTFRIKLAALRCFRSQWLTMFTLLWSVYVRALKEGIMNGHLLAETFHKVKT
ncbi:hypothetical protein COV93_07740 [Candidatus Woesearchaeota archaeon CG11_big_fil_rev_8_21_14_0_20_43_8]|nr:MAG: hypothetical protein COV93_07740 [Candidatus Woesearchaeota archaeon CG11_big_fil_rev_8_21_14_0_20_43_8]PIO04917.1 MAG: hypothetical protein COT47_06950 [Candidatus Woesearchaeota archaeon CG08_land_8_20_14_0_20_43_7]